ncbi:hypothetical protein BJV77DRAFT_60825 [Russula vinacea]|nr:hypothetical protein BJV77DRAFT_60825 [Russula vinacea]
MRRACCQHVRICDLEGPTRRRGGPTGRVRGNARGNAQDSTTPHINQSSSDRTPSLTPRIGPKLGRNIEHWWYDETPANQSAAPPGSPSITPKLSWTVWPLIQSTPPSIDCASSPTTWNSSRLGRNIEQDYRDVSPANQDAAAAPSLSISPKTPWLDSGLLRRTRAPRTADKASPQQGSVLPRRPCNLGRCRTSSVELQGLGAAREKFGEEACEDRITLSDRQPRSSPKAVRIVYWYRWYARTM